MFDPNDFYNLARELLSKLPCPEAVRRTAIGRGYYAAFLRAREKIKQRRPELLQRVERRDIHWAVRDALKTMNQGNISGKLLKLSEIRGMADYDMHAILGKQEADDALLLSENITRLLANV